MNRLEATRIVVQAAGADPVVASLGHPTYDLFAAGDRPQNFYTWGSMGLASSIGLGLAMARPDLRVFVVDGDGSLLMNLGSLATVGLLRPSNLVVVVMDNEEYATTGGQLTPTAHGADLAAAAAAMAIAPVARAASESELRAALADARFVLAKVTESAPGARPSNDCVFLKERFMSAIGNPEGSAA
jgi:thiamine pyrophosphate-dependent acetolactate synthase large subunit-like protein